MYSTQIERQEKFLLSLRASIPIVILTALLGYVIFSEQRSLLFNLTLSLGTLFVAVYYIFFIIFTGAQETVLDEISGAFNRRYFEKNFKKLARGKSFLVLVSIDNIKEINERYGIENGDKILREFAKIVDQFFSLHFGAFPLARLKAGDFLLLLRGEEEEIKKSIEKFLETYDNGFIDSIEIKLYASYQPLEHKNLKTLIDRLYEDIYFCKGRCKNRRKERGFVQKRRSDGDFDSLIVQMVQQRRLSLLFQPVRNLKTDRFDFAEIIVKLYDEGGNIIHPSQFIPAINRMGLENEFDLALTEVLLRSVASLEIPEFRYSFNLSPYSVRNREFTQKFFEIFDRFAAPKHNFIIELYENSIYKDVDYFKRVIDLYKQQGFSIAFDNFGACNASIEYIKSIDIDFVHFDKFFTKKIDDLRYRTLLHSWIDAMQRLGSKSVVKFIDSLETLAKAKEVGADYVEGFAIAKPMSEGEFKKWRQEHALR